MFESRPCLKTKLSKQINKKTGKWPLLLSQKSRKRSFERGNMDSRIQKRKVCREEPQKNQGSWEQKHSQPRAEEIFPYFPVSSLGFPVVIVMYVLTLSSKQERGRGKSRETHPTHWSFLFPSFSPGPLVSAIWLLQELLSQADSRILEVAMFLSILSISSWKDLLSILTKLGPNAASDCPSAPSFLLKRGCGVIHLPSSTWEVNSRRSGVQS